MGCNSKERKLALESRRHSRCHHRRRFSIVLGQSEVYSVSPAGDIARRNILTHVNGWTSAGASPFSDMLASAGRLYVVGPNSTVIARDKDSGAVLWRSREPDAGDLRLSMVRGMLFVQLVSLHNERS